jgi:ATP-dependent exoDNAse (exonuclease V) alpha subunit
MKERNDSDDDDYIRAIGSDDENEKKDLEYKLSYVDKFGRTRNLRGISNKDLLHSHALTIHKTQGETYREIAIIIDKPYIEWKLLYTAISRPSHKLTIYYKQSFIICHEPIRNGFFSLKRALASSKTP